MLAEIFFLRLEAIARASQEGPPSIRARFVPLSPDALSALKERHQRDNGKNVQRLERRLSPVTGPELNPPRLLPLPVQRPCKLIRRSTLHCGKHDV